MLDTDKQEKSVPGANANYIRKKKSKSRDRRTAIKGQIELDNEFKSGLDNMCEHLSTPRRL